MAVTLAPAGKQYFFNTITGQPLAGGYVYTYLAGTSTPAPTYQDAAGLTANTNPIVLNSAGYATIYFTVGTSYKEVVTDGSAPFPTNPTIIVGVVQWTQDNMQGVPAGTIAVDVPGVAVNVFAANQCGHLSDGSGGRVPGQWYQADIGQVWSSVTPIIGFATTAIAAGGTGTFRLSGALSGFTSLSVGAFYYVSAAGAITPTPPSPRRFVGQAQSTTTLIVAANPPPTPPAPVYATVQSAASQSLPSGTYTPVTFDTLTVSVPPGLFNAGTPSRLTVPAAGAGLYLATGLFAWGTSNAGTLRIGVLRKNGTPIAQHVVPPNAFTWAENLLTVVLPLADGDYVELYGYQDTGGALATVGTVPIFSLARLGPAT